MGERSLPIKEFKIFISLELLASFAGQKLSCLKHCPSKHTKAQRLNSIPSSHLPIFLERRRRCTICSQAGKGSKIILTCSVGAAMFCCQKERNCFLQYHS